MRAEWVVLGVRDAIEAVAHLLSRTASRPGAGTRSRVASPRAQRLHLTSRTERPTPRPQDGLRCRLPHGVRSPVGGDHTQSQRMGSHHPRHQPGDQRLAGHPNRNCADAWLIGTDLLVVHPERLVPWNWPCATEEARR